MAVPPVPETLSTVPTPWLVWGRSGVLGAVALGTGAVSHVLGGGHLPGPGAMVLLLASCVLAAALFLRVRATALRLVVLVVAGQTVVHGALSALAGHRGDPAAVASTPVGASAAGPRPSRFFDHYEAVAQASTAPGASAAPRADWLAHQVEHLTAQGPAMVAAHLAGAVALGLFLSIGESALWSLLALALSRAVTGARLSVRVLRAAGVRCGVALRAGLLGEPVVPLLRPSLLDRRPPGRRGPPFVLAA